MRRRRGRAERCARGTACEMSAWSVRDGIRGITRRFAQDANRRRAERQVKLRTRHQLDERKSDRDECDVANDTLVGSAGCIDMLQGHVRYLMRGEARHQTLRANVAGGARRKQGGERDTALDATKGWKRFETPRVQTYSGTTWRSSALSYRSTHVHASRGHVEVPVWAR